MRIPVPPRSLSALLALALGLGCASLPADLQPDKATPPVAARHPKDVSVHGDKRLDEYFWLRQRDNPAVQRHLRAENAYFEKVLAPTKPLQEKLYQELKARMIETDVTVPVRKGAWMYFTRTEAGKQYPIYLRRGLADGAPEETLLDVNRVAQGHDYTEIGHFSVSDDGRFLLYTIDRTGHLDYDLRVLDLKTGKQVPQDIGKVSSVVWAADNNTLFYVKEDSGTKRPFRLECCQLESGRRHRLYEEKDPLFDVDVARTLDGKWIVAASRSRTTTELSLLPADNPQASPRVLVPRREGVECDLDLAGDRAFLLTNDQANNFRVMSAPVTEAPPAWTELVPHRPGVKIDSMTTFADRLVLKVIENAIEEIEIVDPATGTTRRLPWPEAVHSVDFEANYEPGTQGVRLSYQSPVTPPTVVLADLHDPKQATLKVDKVPGYDPARYRCERLLATAADGTRIPVTLSYRIDLRQGRPQPLWLYGYGAYGIIEPPGFIADGIGLMDRGFIMATAHVRGGGEGGKPWQEHGRMAEKMNSFTDFLACADFLVKEGWTTPAQTVVEGGSAGGLLIAASLNLRPGLARAALLEMPFVDVVNTMLDESLPLTTSEFLEWGNPKKKDEYAWIRAYSPYDNISASEYPAMLVQGALNDSQVPYWEPVKYVARLRARSTGRRPILLKMDLSSGHGGASGRYEALRDTALRQAFALEALEVAEGRADGK